MPPGVTPDTALNEHRLPVIDAIQVDRSGAIAELRHPVASHEIPSFITAPDETDVLMVVMSLFLALAVVMFGIMFLRLHTLPERMAHKSQKMQFEIVAVLGLIALFTHMHIFWIAGLLLAMIDFPDFGTSLGRIAASTEKIAGIKPSDGAAELQPETMAAGIKQAREGAGVQLERCEVAREARWRSIFIIDSGREGVIGILPQNLVAIP